MLTWPILIFCLSVAHSAIVTLPEYGSVEGTEGVSRSGEKYFIFRGIQYGKAPKDELRFQDPQKADPWTETRKAVEFANVCPQVDFLEKKVVGDENCLFLNVFTPKLDTSAELPVMLWIHAGNFAVGSGSTYGPDYIMDHPVVFVTFNYRLATLGFMHMDDEFLSGNYGMKDQIMVMEWVRDNIHLFGGNAKAVTLAGSNSGAASVNWHMYAPRSKGLFHRAICQSGTARSIWAEIPRHVAQKRANAIATMAGCVYESTKEVVKCLQKVPADKLIELQQHFEIWKGNPPNFGVVVELPNAKNFFVTISPWTSAPISANIPLIIGYNADEGGYIVKGLLANRGEAINELGGNYRTLLPILMQYQFNTRLKSNDGISKVTKEIKTQYFDQKKITAKTFDQLKWVKSSLFSESYTGTV